MAFTVFGAISVAFSIVAAYNHSRSYKLKAEYKSTAQQWAMEAWSAAYILGALAFLVK